MGCGIGENRCGRPCHVRFRDGRASPPGGGAADLPRIAELGEEFQVEGIAEEGPVHPGCLDVLFGVPVIAGVGEHRVGGGLEEGRVDDVLDAGLLRGVHERPVHFDAIGRFRGRHHEEDVDALQGFDG